MIAPTVLTDFTPLYCEPGGGNLVTQFDKDDVEAVGLVKFDFLGLRTLTIIDWALKTINRERQNRGEPGIDMSAISWDDEATYAGSGSVASTRTYEWNHGIAEILTSLTDAGLRIELFREHREAEWQALPHMELGDDGLWRLPPHQRDLVPLSFTIQASRPA